MARLCFLVLPRRVRPEHVRPARKTAKGVSGRRVFRVVKRMSGAGKAGKILLERRGRTRDGNPTLNVL